MFNMVVRDLNNTWTSRVNNVCFINRKTELINRKKYIIILYKY